jgi:hypothetical protein
LTHGRKARRLLLLDSCALLAALIVALPGDTQDAVTDTLCTLLV